MVIQLIEGKFSAKDALELLTQMINVKIRYHESKIDINSSEEDIKSRETNIKKLQNELFELRVTMDSNSKNLIIDGILKLAASLTQRQS
jgi:hypothetical protein